MLCIPGINYNWKYIQIEIHYFKLEYFMEFWWALTTSNWRTVVYMHEMSYCPQCPLEWDCPFPLNYTHLLRLALAIRSFFSQKAPSLFLTSLRNAINFKCHIAVKKRFRPKIKASLGAEFWLSAIVPSCLVANNKQISVSLSCLPK